MEIHKIRLDSNIYQSVVPKDDNIWKNNLLKLDAQPKLETWKTPAVYVHNPKKKRGNFFHVCSGGIVVDSIALEKLRDFFEMAGELLPIDNDGEILHLVNILECVNCLDDRKTQWILGKTTGAKIDIKKYEFYPDRISESTLFKIPETAAGEVLATSRIKDPEDEFKSVVDREGLTGILFEKLWSN
jgi:hypothetical protein